MLSRESALRSRLPNKQGPRLGSEVVGPHISAKLNSCQSPLFCFLLCNPFICAGVEEIEGEGSAVEHFVVKGADVKFGA